MATEVRLCVTNAPTIDILPESGMRAMRVTIAIGMRLVHLDSGDICNTSMKHPYVIPLCDTPPHVTLCNSPGAPLDSTAAPCARGESRGESRFGGHGSGRGRFYRYSRYNLTLTLTLTLTPTL
jgi:hypothetical protein